MSCYLNPDEEDQCVFIAFEGELTTREAKLANQEVSALMSAKQWNRVVVDLLGDLPLPSVGRHDDTPLEGLLNPSLSWLGRIFAPEVQKMPHPLNLETFLEFVVGHRYAVIHFWAPWNARDGLMNKFLTSGVSGRLRRQIAFASFNVDVPEHLDLVRQHKVFDVPMIAFYRDGLLVQTETGGCGVSTTTKHLRELVSYHAAG
jgi:hypothetical protein